MNKTVVAIGLLLMIGLIITLSQHITGASGASPVSLSGSLNFSLPEFLMLIGMALGLVFIFLTLMRSARMKRPDSSKS